MNHEERAELREKLRRIASLATAALTFHDIGAARNVASIVRITGTLTPELPDDVRRLVIAAREVLDEYGRDTLRALDKDSEAFSSRVPYENEPRKWVPHLDYAGEPMRAGDFRDAPEARHAAHGTGCGWHVDQRASDCDCGHVPAMTSATAWPQPITPADVHPSHDVREEGYMISDPVCQNCRRGTVENAEAMREPCEPMRGARAPYFVASQDSRTDAQVLVGEWGLGE